MLLASIWSDIWNGLVAQSGLEWMALIANVLYVVLAAKRKRLCWLFGAIGAVTTGIVLVEVDLFSDAVLQAYYFAMAIYGWFAWQTEEQEVELEIKRMVGSDHLMVFAIALPATIAFGMFWKQFGAAFPYIDGATTAFSFLATWMVVKKYLENWVYWIVIDLVTIVIYWIKGLYLFSFLFVFFTIIAIWGYLAWRKALKQKTPARK